jgi:hypothetical protein
MKEELKKQIESEIKSLRAIVEEIFIINLFEKSRKRNHVKGRMVYAKILRERGLKYTTIGDGINKDHSTIIYYVSNAEHQIKYDKDLYDKYKRCQDLFLDNRGPIVYKSIEDELRTYIVKLKTQIQRQQDFRRFERVVQMFGEKIPVGEEQYLEKKVREMLGRIRKFK